MNSIKKNITFFSFVLISLMGLGQNVLIEVQLNIPDSIYTAIIKNPNIIMAYDDLTCNRPLTNAEIEYSSKNFTKSDTNAIMALIYWEITEQEGILKLLKANFVNNFKVYYSIENIVSNLSDKENNILFKETLKAFISSMNPSVVNSDYLIRACDINKINNIEPFPIKKFTLYPVFNYLNEDLYFDYDFKIVFTNFDYYLLNNHNDFSKVYFKQKFFNVGNTFYCENLGLGLYNSFYNQYIWIRYERLFNSFRKEYLKDNYIINYYFSPIHSFLKSNQSE